MEEKQNQGQIFHLVYQDIFYLGDHDTVVVATDDEEALKKAKSYLNYKGINQSSLKIMTEEVFQAEYGNKQTFYLYYLIDGKQRFCRIFATGHEEAKEILLRRFGNIIEICQVLDQEQFNNRDKKSGVLTPPPSTRPYPEVAPMTDAA